MLRTASTASVWLALGDNLSYGWMDEQYTRFHIFQYANTGSTSNQDSGRRQREHIPRQNVRSLTTLLT